ncbi:hypothetical protein GCM10022267_88440 [Lentzea roselyniae]|uniref:RNA polymerase sigma-70 factor, ECF subfamily n=1 Tax=Lentzea roselyniae TaxID=531940 RepID=A0ABP7CD96_9PSEU
MKPTLCERELRSLMAVYHRPLLAYATRITGDGWLAEDLVQEALTRLWQRPEVVSNRARITPWLFTVVRNLLIDRARARARRPHEVFDVCDNVQQDHADETLMSMTVTAMLDGLTPQHREVLEHVYLRDSTLRQAARELNIPEGTAKSRLRNALRLLRDDLRDPLAA